MAVAFRAAAQAFTNTTSLLITKPAGTAQDDVMVAVVISEGAFTPPSGWTEITTETQAAFATTKSYYKVAGGSEPADYTWTFSAGDDHCGGISTYSGVDTSAPINAFGDLASLGDATPDAPSIVTTVANCMLVLGGSNTSGNTVTFPGGATERVDINTGVDGTDRCAWLGDEPLGAAGATGTRTFTVGGVPPVQGDDVPVGIAIALAPLPDAPGPSLFVVRSNLRLA